MFNLSLPEATFTSRISVVYGPEDLATVCSSHRHSIRTEKMVIPKILAGGILTILMIHPTVY